MLLLDTFKCFTNNVFAPLIFVVVVSLQSHLYIYDTLIRLLIKKWGVVIQKFRIVCNETVTVRIKPKKSLVEYGNGQNN